jgi:hypothetical protein
MKASPSASSGFKRILICVRRVRNRAASGMPVPSPQVKMAPLAVVNVIEPRRINRLRKRRNKRSIDFPQRIIADDVTCPFDRRWTASRVPKSNGFDRLRSNEFDRNLSVKFRYCLVDKADISKYRVHLVALAASSIRVVIG